MVEREVSHEPHAAAVNLRDELLEVLHGAVIGMDGVVVRDVVAVIFERGGIERRKPETIDAEPL